MAAGLHTVGSPSRPVMLGSVSPLLGQGYRTSSGHLHASAVPGMLHTYQVDPFTEARNTIPSAATPQVRTVTSPLQPPQSHVPLGSPRVAAKVLPPSAVAGGLFPSSPQRVPTFVGERTISRDEMMRSGHLVRGPSATLEVGAGHSPKDPRASVRVATASSSSPHLRPEGPEILPQEADPTSHRQGHAGSSSSQRLAFVPGQGIIDSSTLRQSSFPTTQVRVPISASVAEMPSSPASREAVRVVPPPGDVQLLLQLRQQLQIAESAVQAKEGVEMELKQLLAVAEAKAQQDRLDIARLEQEGAEYKVELARSAHMRESLQDDLYKESNTSRQLKSQLSAEQFDKDVTVRAAADIKEEVGRLRARNVELKAECDRGAHVRDSLQRELTTAETASASLRKELAVTEAMLHAPMRNGSEGHPGTEELRLLRQQVEQMQEELKGSLALREQLEKGLEKERASSAEMQRRLRAAEAAGLAFHPVGGPLVPTGSARTVGGERTVVGGARSSADLGSQSSSKPVLLRQLSTRSADVLFQAAAADDVPRLQQALAGEDAAVELVFRARDPSGRTLIQVCLAADALEAAKFLLEAGKGWADRRKYFHELQTELLERDLGRLVNDQDESGRAALSMHVSTETASREITVMLLRAHADPTQRDAQGVTPFIESAKAGHMQIMGLLLNVTNGLVLMDADEESRTALHWAAQEGRQNAVEMLLKVNADIDAADTAGRTAADVARNAGHTIVLALLVDAMENGSQRGSESECTEPPEVPPEVGGMDGDGLDFDIPDEEHVEDDLRSARGQLGAGFFKEVAEGSGVLPPTARPSGGGGWSL